MSEQLQKVGPPAEYRGLDGLNAGLNLLPPLSEDERTLLKESIKAEGVLMPIVIDEDGEVVEGHHRFEIAQELGLPEVPVLLRSMLDPAEKQAFQLRLNLARRHLGQEQKRDLIARLLKADPNKSDRAIASVVAVDNKTVGSVRSALEASEEIPHVAKRTGSNGRKQPASKGTSRTRRQPAKRPSTAKRTIKPASEAVLPITFDDQNVPTRIQAVADAQQLSVNAWCVQVLTRALEEATPEAVAA